MKNILALIFLLWSCSEPRKHQPPTPSQKELLQQKVDLYSTLIKSKQDKAGFIETDKCDSTTLSALLPGEVDITKAELQPGRWLRRPIYYPECYASGLSRSDISRDAIVSLIYYAVTRNNLGILERLWDYGSSHSWFMGQEAKEHSIMSPVHISLLAQAIYHVSKGKHDYAIRHTRYPMLVAGKGFEGHLQALQYLIAHKTYSMSVMTDFKVIEELAKTRSRNALVQYLAGDTDKAIDILLNVYPSDRLPNSSDWCSSWLTMMDDQDEGVKPCYDGREHSGGDFLMVAKLVLET